MSQTRILAVLMAFTIGLLTIGLGGCITTESGVFTDPASPEVALQRRVELARKYIGEGNWQDAKRNLRMAADIDPDNAEVHEAFALVYQSTGEFDLAEDSFKRAISLDKDFSRARNNYAAFLFSQSRFQEAEDQLEYVVKDTLYVQRPQAFVNLGLCRVKLFDPEGAEQAFIRALSMDRTNVIALLETAELRYNVEDYESASRYYGSYRRSIRQQSARGLWLGVRLSHESGDRNAESSYALALGSLYPDSIEFEAYQREFN